MNTTAQHMLSQKVSSMSESATIKMSQKARNLRAQGHDVISLSLGEPDFDTPDHIKAQIVVSNGAKQSIANICLSILDPGDEVIIFTPYWVSYFEIVKFAGGTPIQLAAGIDQDFKVSPEQLDNAINHKTKAIIFSSPCNPTGSVYTRDELEGLAEVISNYENLIVISDEIYEYINFTGQHASIGAIESMRDRVATVNGMSKGFAYVFPDVSSYYGKSNGTVIIDNSVDFAELILESAHVALVAGSAFGEDNCIRLSYAASDEILKEAIRRIAECLKEFK